MSVTSSERANYILDTCILVDYLRVDPEILILISMHLGAVILPTPVLDELIDTDEEELKKLDVSIYEPELEVVIRAKALEKGTGLSFIDATCAIVAGDMKCGLVTNDKRLRSYCSANNIDTVWGLQFILEIWKHDGISSERALNIAEEIQQNDPHYFPGKIVKEFRLKLRRKL